MYIHTPQQKYNVIVTEEHRQIDSFRIIASSRCLSSKTSLSNFLVAETQIINYYFLYYLIESLSNPNTSLNLIFIKIIVFAYYACFIKVVIIHLFRGYYFLEQRSFQLLSESLLYHPYLQQEVVNNYSGSHLSYLVQPREIAFLAIE